MYNIYEGWGGNTIVANRDYFVDPHLSKTNPWISHCKHILCITMILFLYQNQKLDTWTYYMSSNTSFVNRYQPYPQEVRQKVVYKCKKVGNLSELFWIWQNPFVFLRKGITRTSKKAKASTSRRWVSPLSGVKRLLKHWLKTRQTSILVKTVWVQMASLHGIYICNEKKQTSKPCIWSPIFNVQINFHSKVPVNHMPWTKKQTLWVCYFSRDQAVKHHRC